MNSWSRTERIALVTSLIGLLAALAAWLVVPEFRQITGLDLHARFVSEPTKPLYEYSDEDSLKYIDNGISFDYPRSTKVSTQNVTRNDGSVAIIQLKAQDDIMALIQKWSVPISPEEVRKALIDSFVKQDKSRNAEILAGTGKTVRRRIDGTQQEGQLFEDMVSGFHFMTEVYAFKKDKAVIAVILIHNMEAAAKASKYFATITESLTVRAL